MGRPGAGGGGSRVGGGRRMGQSKSTGSRPGSSRGPSGGGHRGPSGGGHRGPGGFGGGPRHHAGPRHHGGPRPHHHHHHHHVGPRRHYGGYGRRVYSGRSNPLSTILAYLIVFFIVIAVVKVWEKMPHRDREVHNNYSSYENDNNAHIRRERIETSNPFIEDCITDELGWFENAATAENQLKSFWEATGVQPYIILKGYDANLKSDKQKDQWAMDYYAEFFDTENIFLYVYFAEKDADNVAGYASYASGTQAAKVMDEEVANLFLDNLDRYWKSDLSTDDMFVKAFNDTADEIME